MEQQFFSASLDRTARISTAFVGLLLIGIGWVSFGVVGRLHNESASWLPVLIILLVTLLCYLLHPQGYLVSANEIIIRRQLFQRSLRRSEVDSASVLEKEAISWSIRTFGVGGLFGYYGKFSNSKLGAMTWYLTRRDRLVLLRMRDGRKIVLSPDEPAEFVAAIGY